MKRLTFKEMIDKYVEFRHISNLKDSTLSNLVIFYNTLKKQYSVDVYLTQDMVDGWCQKRISESIYSYNSRISPIISFLQYAIQRNWVYIDIPQRGHIKSHYIHHAFTDNELRAFFKACDEIEIKLRKQEKLRKVEVPVFFRLLYSTGLRTTEARLLRCENVDLHNGIINILYTKGYNQHHIVLHDTMKKLLLEYDNKMNVLMPNRKIFFPTVKDTCHLRQWVSVNFKKLWFKYNTARAIPYDLRHNYAILNINKWMDVNVDDKLLALSKSMGHSSISSTMYYYSFVPQFAELMRKLSCENYDNIIPKLPDYE